MALLTGVVTTYLTVVGNNNSVWIDTSNDIYMGGNVAGRMSKVTAAKVYTAVWGGTGTAGFADGVQGTGTVNMSGGICGDATNVYFGDPTNHMLRYVVKASRTVGTLAGSSANVTNIDGTGAAAGFASGPNAMCIDTTSGVIYAVCGTLIRTINTATGAVATLSVALPAACAALAISPDRKLLYGIYLGRIWRMPVGGGYVEMLVGQGSQATDTDGPGRTATIKDASQMIVSSDGLYLYISESTGSRVRVMPTAAPWQLLNVAGDGTTATVTDGTGAAAQFRVVRGIGLLYGQATETAVVTDYNGAALRQLT